MKSLLILERIEVTNANAISGITYGFPSPTHFLGFAHALARKLPGGLGERLGGVAIICHKHQLVAHEKKYGERILSLTRNPLTKEGETAPLVEEGRMHMTVSLVIACDFGIHELDESSPSPEEDKQNFETSVKQICFTQRLAGGRVDTIKSVRLVELGDEEKEKVTRRHLRKLLPGFCLVDRSLSLATYYQEKKAENENTDFLECWLDFSALKYQAVPNAEDDAGDVEWELLPKPADGWLVPLQVGYRAISEVYAPGLVKGVRDKEYPCAFVEAAYGVGGWISPHRIKNIDQILWKYRQREQWYLCENLFEA